MRIVTSDCRHGSLSYMADDEFVGRSLATYGEYSELELLAMSKIVRPGDTVVEVGANVGALTVPLARMVEPGGRVLAFEPQPDTFDLLARNIEANGLTTVTASRKAVSDDAGTIAVPALGDLDHRNYGRVEVGNGALRVEKIRLDDLKLDKLKLLKIDVEGHEGAVIAGAAETIKRCRPIIYVENDRTEKSAALISQIVDLGYRLYWHRPPLFNADNFSKAGRNVFGNIVSINMLCCPVESKIEVDGMDEVADLRMDGDIYNREIERYAKIVEVMPGDLRARLMLAHYHSLMQNTDEAARLVDENLRRDPNHVATRAIQAMHLLQRGEWSKAWPAYELRYEQKRAAGFGARPRDGCKWNGEPTTENVLIWCEQGFGDSIMFGRFIDDALQRAPNAFVEVQPQLFELFERCIMPTRLIRMGRLLPDYSLHCSIPSLPAVLGITTDEQIRRSQYLSAEPAMVAAWRNKPGAPRVGLCWAGSPNSERPYTRDIDPDLFKPIAEQFGPLLSLVNEGQFDSYSDTAAAIASLDLVITVDTSVAHLAGAMGVETWLLLSFDPDWRWGLTGDRSLWYDSVRIFRQSKLLDWSGVIADVTVALAARRNHVSLEAAPLTVELPTTTGL